MDKFDEIFKKQIELQNKLEVKFNQAYINIMSLALIDEIMEAIRETPWKPWKKQQVLNNDKFQKELIDAWHFLINLSLASGMNANEVYAKFCEKNLENQKRKDEGY